MIRKLLLMLTLFYTVCTMAQQTIIDKLNFGDNTILVGMASDYNTNKAYDKLNFIIDNPSDLKDLKLNFEHGYELSTKLTDENHFMIYAIKDKKIIDQWLVNPKIYNVYYNGIAYSFDADKLEEIAAAYPLNVSIERMQFKNEKEYKKLKKAIDKDPSIILFYEPSFVFEGTYEISLPKDKTIKTAEEAEAYFNQLIKPLTNKQYSVSYALNERNLMDRSQFTLIVSGPKVIFDKLPTNKGTKGEWTPEVYEAISVKRK